jgi:superfamily I DNA and/or RNA helicase
VGIAIFSLAKKAMVVGDVKQIEPVWNILPKIDVGNLSKFGLLQTERNDEISSLIDNGFLASSGSIMKMAQHACGFIDPQNKLKERGMMLVEHRRCNDEIIQYCNDLAYMNMLRPMKGKAKSCQLFPSMLLSHVEGKPRSVNKERVNEEEAAFIVTWLIENKNLIESHYAKAKPVRIEDLVGVITPFRAQKILISNRLREAGFDTSSMKIGTVHALQGAEREIIIFSTVYGKGQVGTMFFDRENKPNMLNVAVSRAKETFMVVGNAYIFNAQTQTPSGLLDKYLQKQIPSGQIQ